MLIHFREFDKGRFKDLYLDDLTIVSLNSHNFPPGSFNSDFGTSTKILTSSGQTHLVFGEPAIVQRSIENQGGRTGGNATAGASNLILELQRRLLQEAETNSRLRDALDRKIEECALLEAQLLAAASTPPWMAASATASTPPWMAASAAAPDTEASWLDAVDELTKAEVKPVKPVPKPVPKPISKPATQTDASRFALLEID